MSYWFKTMHFVVHIIYKLPKSVLDVSTTSDQGWNYQKMLIIQAIKGYLKFTAPSSLTANARYKEIYILATCITNVYKYGDHFSQIVNNKTIYFILFINGN